MKDLFCLDYRDAIRNVVRKEMKQKFGIKVPKFKDKEKNKIEPVSILSICTVIIINSSKIIFSQLYNVRHTSLFSPHTMFPRCQ